MSTVFRPRSARGTQRCSRRVPSRARRPDIRYRLCALIPPHPSERALFRLSALRERAGVGAALETASHDFPHPPRSARRPLPLAERRRRRLRRAGVTRLDDRNDIAFRHRPIDPDANLLHDARDTRRHFHRRLVGFERDEALVLRDRVARLDEHFDDRHIGVLPMSGTLTSIVATWNSRCRRACGSVEERKDRTHEGHEQPEGS